jgi:hypothetical protein
MGDDLLTTQLQKRKAEWRTAPLPPAPWPKKAERNDRRLAEARRLHLSAERRPLDFGSTVGSPRFIEATTLRPNGQANRPCLRAPKDARRTRSG